MSPTDYAAIGFLAVCALWGVTGSYNRLRHIVTGLLVGCLILALVGWLGPQVLPDATAGALQDGRVIPTLADHAEHSVRFMRGGIMKIKGKTR